MGRPDYAETALFVWIRYDLRNITSQIQKIFNSQFSILNTQSLILLNPVLFTIKRISGVTIMNRVAEM